MYWLWPTTVKHGGQRQKGGSLTELKIKLICTETFVLNPVQWGPHTRTSPTVCESVASLCIKGSILLCQKVLGFICKGRYRYPMSLAAHNEKGETLSPEVCHAELFLSMWHSPILSFTSVFLLTPGMVASEGPRHHSLWSKHIL